MAYQEIVSSQITFYTEGTWASTSISPSYVFMNCDQQNKNPQLKEIEFYVTQVVESEYVRPVFVTDGDAIINNSYTITSNGAEFTFTVVNPNDTDTTLRLKVSTKSDYVFTKDLYQIPLKFRSNIDEIKDDYYEYCYLTFARNKEAVNGIDGAGLVFLGPWSSTYTYVLNNIYRECVATDGEDENGNYKKIYYMSRLLNEFDPSKRGQLDTKPFTGIDPVTDTKNIYWIPFEGQFKSVATELLLAEDAVFGTANTTKLWIGYKGSFDTNGNPVDITKADGWVMESSSIKSIRKISEGGQSAVELSASGAIILRDPDAMVVSAGLYSGEDGNGNWSIGADGVARFKEVYADNIGSIGGWSSTDRGLEWFEDAPSTGVSVLGSITGASNYRVSALNINKDGDVRYRIATGVINLTSQGNQFSVALDPINITILNKLSKNGSKYLVTKVSYIFEVLNGSTIIHKSESGVKQIIHGIDSQNGITFSDSIQFTPFTISPNTQYTTNVYIQFNRDTAATGNADGSNNGELIINTNNPKFMYSAERKTAKLYHDEFFMGYENNDQFRVYYDENNDLKIKLKGDLEVDGDITATAPGKTHVHNNFDLLENITQADVTSWTNKASKEDLDKKLDKSIFDDIFEVSSTGVKVKGSLTATGELASYVTGDIDGGGGSGGASTLNELSDVKISNPSKNQILKYNGTHWINSSDSGVASWDELTDKPEWITKEKPTASTFGALSDTGTAADSSKLGGKIAADYALKTSIPTSLPASDVYTWAKQPNKPSYTASEVGALPSNGTAVNSDKLGNVEYTRYFLSYRRDDGALDLNTYTTRGIKELRTLEQTTTNSPISGYGQLLNFWDGQNISAIQFVAGSNNNDYFIRTKHASSNTITSNWNRVYHSGNSNKSNVDWSANNLYANIYRLSGCGNTAYLGGSSTEAYLWTEGSQILKFGTNSQERMRITNVGNVGIGTTNPSARLHVYGTAINNTTPNTIMRVTGDNYGAAVAGQTNAITIAGSIGDGQIRDRVRIGGTYRGSNVSDMTFWTQDNADSITEKMRITDTGRVGIGTSTPSVPLAVIGEIKSYKDSGNNTVSVFSGSKSLYLWAGDNTGLLTDSDFIIGGTNYGAKLFLKSSNGNIGIGTTTPSEKLHVNGNVKVNGNIIATGEIVAYTESSGQYEAVYAPKVHTHTISDIENLETRLQEAASSADLTNYLTKESAKETYQPIGNYLTSIPSTYYNSSNCNNASTNWNADNLWINDIVTRKYNFLLNTPYEGKPIIKNSWVAGYDDCLQIGASGTAAQKVLSMGSNGTFNWDGKTIYHSGNSNKSTIDWTTNNLTSSGNIKISNNENILELWRGTNSSWRIKNAANLYIQNNYTTAAGDYFDVLTLSYVSGNATLKGQFDAKGGLLSNGSAVWTASNSNKSTVDWTTKDLTVAGNATIAGNSGADSPLIVNATNSNNNASILRIRRNGVDQATIGHWNTYSFFGSNAGGGELWLLDSGGVNSFRFAEGTNSHTVYHSGNVNNANTNWTAKTYFVGNEGLSAEPDNTRLGSFYYNNGAGWRYGSTGGFQFKCLDHSSSAFTDVYLRTYRWDGFSGWEKLYTEKNCNNWSADWTTNTLKTNAINIKRKSDNSYAYTIEAASSTDNTLNITNSSGGSDIAFFTNIQNSVSEKMRITSVGNVGIGTTNPSVILDTMRSVENVAVRTSVVRFGGNANGNCVSGQTNAITISGSIGDGQIRERVSVGGTYVGGNTSAMTFWTQDNADNITEKMRIMPTSGNVGIGTGNPGYKLDVNGTGRFTNTITSTLSQGTAPISVASSTLCPNLNAQYFENRPKSQYQGRFNTLLDLTAGSDNIYYPVIINVDVRRMCVFEIAWNLEGYKPSWATHQGGFSMNLKWSVMGSGWGNNLSVQRTIHNYTHAYASVSPCGGITQMTYSSKECVYLRGGTKYNLYTSFETEVAIKFDTYTVSGQTVYCIDTPLNNVWSSASSGASFNTLFSKVIRSADDSTITFNTSAIDRVRINHDGSTEFGLNETYKLFIGHPSFSWGGDSYPTLYSSYADRWVMLCNPHIPFLANGQRGYTGTTKGSSIRFEGAISGAQPWEIGVGVGGNTADKFSIGRNYGRAFVIDNIGKIGIGVTSPTQMLHVAGNILATGEVTAYSSSDIRLKENIKPINNAIDIINKLNPVSFEWNDKAKELNTEKDDRTNYGLIAQEVEEVLPELIHPIYDDYKSVDYQQLIGVLIKAVQEQQNEINNLKQLINNNYGKSNENSECKH